MSELERMLEKRAARRERGTQYRWLMRWAGRAMEAPLAVVVGMLMGVAVDKNFGTNPWGMWVGLFFGVLTAGRFAYRLVRDYRREFPDEP